MSEAPTTQQQSQPQRPACQSSPRYRMNSAEAARYLGISETLLNRLRVRGGGPLFSRISIRVVYDSADLDAYLESTLCATTADGRR